MIKLLTLSTTMILTSASRSSLAQMCPLPITDPAAVNTNAASDIAVDVAAEVATDGAGTWMVVWVLLSDPEGGGLDKDIVFSRSLDNGVTWTASAPVHNNAETDVAIDITPQIVADGAGNWVVVWYSNDEFGLNLGHDFDIIFVRSADNGATWSDPAPVNTNAVFDGRSDYEPSVASDGAGNLVVVWETNNDLEGTIGFDDDILFARSSDNGQTWSAPAPLASTAGSDVVQDSQARVVTDGDGMWVAAWHAGVWGPPGAPNDWDILYVRSTDDGATWSAPIPLNSNAESDGGSDRFPHLSTDGAGNWIAVWRSNEDLGGDIGNDLDIFVARSSDNAETWSAPAALNSNAAVDDWADFTPRITTDGAGAWVAVWSSRAFLGDDWDAYISLSTDDGQTWTERTRLNTNGLFDSGPDHRPSVASDELGHWIAVWESGDDLGRTIGTDRDILFARFEFSADDLNHNGIPDEQDIADGTSQDCNENAVPDECEPDCNENGQEDSCDIADGVSEDCTVDGIPDECEPDCNDNAVADSCDIADGFSDDCNDNAIPDDCELLDCNGNGQIDLCDIAEGISDDCDGNSVPDECEADCNANGQADTCDITDETSVDCDSNGVPDECEDFSWIIGSHPTDQEAAPGEWAMFEVEADVFLPTYQWRKDGLDLQDDGRIVGSESATLFILDIQKSDAGEYDCLITDTAGCFAISDPGTLTVLTTCPADIDDDGVVGPIDLAMLLGAWGSCADPDACPADLNADGVVGPFDLAALLAAWGECS